MVFWKRTKRGKGGGGRTAEHLAELEVRYRAFRLKPEGITVTIKRAVAVQGDNALVLEMETSRPPKDPTEFLSFVKARLLTDMYRAANYAGQLLGEAEGSFGIQAAGRSFVEPAYYLPVDNQTIGPVSFRQGEYNDGIISFVLMVIGGEMMLALNSPGFMQGLRKLGEGYVNGVRTLEL